MARKKPSPKKPPPSVGVRKRMGRPVIDADEPINMVLTKIDIQRAIAKRARYDVDDPENFSDCALAICLSKMSGAEVQIMRRVAFVAFPDEEYTRRYVQNTPTAGVVRRNDDRELGKVPPNTPVSLLPATPGRRLVAQGGRRVSKQSRGILKNPPRPAAIDPYRGRYRNGVHAPSGAK